MVRRAAIENSPICSNLKSSHHGTSRGFSSVATVEVLDPAALKKLTVLEYANEVAVLTSPGAMTHFKFDCGVAGRGLPSRGGSFNSAKMMLHRTAWRNKIASRLR